MHIKKNQCGRAYLDGSCDECNTHYTDLKVNAEEFFSYDGRVKAIRLRKGCNLTTFLEEGFLGVSNTTDKDLVANYTGNFGSYSCLCDDAKFEPKRPKPRSSLCEPSLLIVLFSINISGACFGKFLLFQGQHH